MEFRRAIDAILTKFGGLHRHNDLISLVPAVIHQGLSLRDHQAFTIAQKLPQTCHRGFLDLRYATCCDL